MANAGSNQKQSTMEDEGLPQTVQNSKDANDVKEPVSTSDEMPSTTNNSTPVVAPIPLEVVFIPAFVYRPLARGECHKRKPRFLSK